MLKEIYSLRNMSYQNISGHTLCWHILLLNWNSRTLPLHGTGSESRKTNTLNVRLIRLDIIFTRQWQKRRIIVTQWALLQRQNINIYLLFLSLNTWIDLITEVLYVDLGTFSQKLSLSSWRHNFDPIKKCKFVYSIKNKSLVHF